MKDPILDLKSNYKFSIVLGGASRKNDQLSMSCNSRLLDDHDLDITLSTKN